MTVRPSLGLGLPVIMMQCDDEVLDNTDPAMYCLELSGKKEHNFDHDTVYSCGYHSISKEILKCLENISLFQA